MVELKIPPDKSRCVEFKPGLHAGPWQTGSDTLVLREQMILVTNTVREDFQQVHGEEGMLLNKALETSGIQPCETGGFSRDGGGAAGRLINESHLAQYFPADGASYRGVSNQHIQRSFK